MANMITIQIKEKRYNQVKTSNQWHPTLPKSKPKSHTS